MNLLKILEFHDVPHYKKSLIFRKSFKKIELTKI